METLAELTLCRDWPLALQWVSVGSRIKCRVPFATYQISKCGYCEALCTLKYSKKAGKMRKKKK